MSNKTKSFAATIGAGVSLLFITWQAVRLSPQIISPTPVWVVALLWLPLPKCLVLSLSCIAMWLWNPSIFLGSTRIPIRTWLLFGILSILSFVYYLKYKSYGQLHQGSGHVAALTVINLLLLLILLFTGVYGSRKPSYKKDLLFHWLLFAWLSSYAFPVFGELP